MKLRTSLLVFLASLQTLSAQDYVVISPCKQVYLLSHDGSQRRLRTGATVSLRDSVLLGEKGCLKIKNPRTSRVFTKNSAGKYRIGDLVNAGLVKQESVVVSALRQSFQNATEKNDAVSYRVGGSKRGALLSLEEKIASHLLHAIGERGSKPSELVLSIIRQGNDRYFEIENATPNSLYINIVAYNKALDDYSLFFNDSIQRGRIQETLNILVPSYSKISFPHCPLSRNRNLRYLVFGLRTPFDCVSLGDLLSSVEERKEIMNAGTIMLEDLVLGAPLSLSRF